MAQKSGSGEIQKYVTDGFSQQLANVLEERHLRIKHLVDEDKACSRDELARFIWGTARTVRSTIKPEDPDTRRRDAWMAAKGMLKELIDFDKFRPQQYHVSCVKMVLEKKTAEVIDNYKNYVLTGEIRTRWFPPKLLGETDEIFCVDKPCLFTCTYGGNKDDLSVPPRAFAESASALLNGEKGEIQIHEYLALKYNYENAVGTREWWATNPEKITCYCGWCKYCATTQSGCCNRLDKETSGVMICAKTRLGFGEIRQQFKSEHSIEKGGTEKYYFALCHGEVKVPQKDDRRSAHWLHNVAEDGRGRVEVTMKWSKDERKSLPYDNGNGPSGSESPQWALTLYEPIAWFSDPKGKDKYTLVHVQIVTGRTHQIRFHLAEVGHSLVGDPHYGAPWADREWAKRVFLHSYQTKFREPFTLRWFEATSPLPPDLGLVLASLKLERVKEPWTGDPYLTRRQHPTLAKFMKQYDPLKALLFSHDPPVSAEALQAAQGQIEAMRAAGKVGAKATVKASAQAAPAVNVTVNVAVESKNNGQSGDQWSSGGQGWDWNSNSWSNDSSWKQDSWQGGGWNSGDWKSEEKEKAAEKPAEKQAVAAKPKDDSDDDDWGGWGGGQVAQQEKPATPSQPAPPSGPPPAHLRQAAAAGQTPSQPSQPAQPAQPSQPPPARLLGTAAARGAPAPEAEPAAKRPRQEVPAGMANQNPHTPPSALPAPAPPAQGWRRMESRSQAGVFYYFNDATGATQVEPPPPWEKKQSRSQLGVFYYWNPTTGQTSVEKPQV